MEAIQARRSVRNYKPDPVPESDLEAILEAARLAPSASNRQPWKFVVVTDPDRRAALCRAARNQAFVGQAPVVIVAVALEPDQTMMCGVERYAVDLAIAVDHITLAAADRGLGTCWIGAFDQEQARTIAGVPDQYKVVTVLPLGYPADEPRPKSRKTLNEIVCREVFSE
ncbi:MAG: nitroreductase family protein [Bacillota bacterium]